MFRTDTNISVQPLIIKPEMSSTPTYLDGLRRLIALKTESDTGANYKNSENDERVGRLQDNECCILTENANANNNNNNNNNKNNNNGYGDIDLTKHKNTKHFEPQL
jgi:hypothetical protein